MIKTEKQEMSYLNYSNALWDCFEFCTAQFDNMLQNKAILPDWESVRTGQTIWWRHIWGKHIPSVPTQ